jgi:hypothetical protein
MSFTKSKDGFEFHCDAVDCTESWVPPSLGRGSEQPEFIDHWQSAKAELWQTRKINGDWKHRCPKCAWSEKNKGEKSDRSPK